MKFLVVLSLAIASSSTLSEARKCDEKIISMIKEKFWENGNLVPKNIMETGVSMSMEIVKRTTRDYYEKEESMKCVAIKPGTPTRLYILYENSSFPQEPSAEVYVTEENGVLIDKERGVYRYFITLQYRGARAFYKCSKTGEIGEPEALIEVSKLGYEEAALAQCEEDLASLGIKLSDKVYGDQCPP